MAQKQHASKEKKKNVVVEKQIVGRSKKLQLIGNFRVYNYVTVLLFVLDILVYRLLFNPDVNYKVGVYAITGYSYVVIARNCGF